eukprot:scaffold29729_cov17-Tisochrysis_lutea.AAC.1
MPPTDCQSCSAAYVVMRSAAKWKQRNGALTLSSLAAAAQAMTITNVMAVPLDCDVVTELGGKPGDSDRGPSNQ